MIKNLFLTIFLGLVVLTAPTVRAESRLTLTTDAPAGTELRIYTAPFGDAIVTGADKSDYAFIYVSKGPGTTITISGTIKEAELYGCQLTSLVAEDMKDMYILRCYNNSITTLDLSNCPGLVVLDAHTNQLSELDLSACPLLENVNVSDNKLESLVTGDLSYLVKLDASKNKLVGVDLSGSKALNELWLNNNNISEFDLSANTNLQWLYVWSNELAGQAMDNFCANVPRPFSSPSYLYIVDTRDDKDGNLCLAENVSVLRNKGWAVLDYYGGEDNNGLIGKTYYGADYVPAVSERTIAFTTGRAVGQSVTLNVAATEMIDIEGVKEDISTGTHTYTLTAQTVKVKGDITSFECPGNDITSLVFEGGVPVLTYLDCHDNKIENLNLVNCTSVSSVYAQQNALRQVNLQGCSGLMRVDVYDNDLNGGAMTDFMRSLPQSNGSILMVIDTKTADEKNVATTNDVKIATDKKWMVKDWSNGDRFGMGIDYAGSEPTGDDKECYFSVSSEMSQFMLNLEGNNISAAEIPVVEGARVIGWNGTLLTIEVSPGQEARIYGDYTTVLSPLQSIVAVDFSNLPNLTMLELGANSLSSIDLTKNPRLSKLSVYGNNLTTIDFSANTSLVYVNCYGNAITGSGMTAMMNSLPRRTAADYGEIIIYDPHYSNERNVCLASDVAAARAKYWVTYKLNSDMNPELYEGESGIENVAVDDAAATEYFDLRGVRVANPSGGIFIERRGVVVTKRYIP